MWIWIAIAVIVIIVIIAVLVSIGSRRRRDAKEVQAKEDRERAARLREEARVAELDSREKNAAAMRKASDAEQAAVAAERLSMEAEQQRTDAAGAAAASREKLAQAAEADPGADASNRARPALDMDRPGQPAEEEPLVGRADSGAGRHAAVEDRTLHEDPQGQQGQVRNPDGTVQGF